MRVTISEARSMYTNYMEEIRAQRQELTKQLKEAEKQGMDGGRYDRVELTKRLEVLDAKLEDAFQKREEVIAQETLIHNAIAGQQEAEAMAEGMEDMLKCLEVARRISQGEKVPASDEKKLMDFNKDLYMAAKNMAFLRAAQEKKTKEHDSLWEEEQEEEQVDPHEVATNTEINVEPIEPLEGAGETAPAPDRKSDV